MEVPLETTPRGWTYQADTNSVVFHGSAIPGRAKPSSFPTRSLKSATEAPQSHFLSGLFRNEMDSLREPVGFHLM